MGIQTMHKCSKNVNVIRCRHKQLGAALPLVVVGLLAMLVVAGLALDTSHALANKSRLQNSVDAAALAAAKEYDQAADIIAANTEALNVFGINADGAGNQELNSAYDAAEISITVQWSETLNPFVSVGLGPYVRVIATGYNLDATLTAVLGVTDIGIAATAVAGPSPSVNTACNVAPMVACALDPDDPDLFGFTPNQVEVLKSSSGGGDPVGPGNFQLIRLECGAGGACVRENLAGSYDSCLANDETVETEPGNTVGPTVQGLNTRFGSYSGSMTAEDYPPDVQTTQPVNPLSWNDTTNTIEQNGVTASAAALGYGWDEYRFDIMNGILSNPPPEGIYERRVLTLPIARCDGSASGQSTLDVVGFGCYFLLQQVVQQGTEAQIFGQFIDSCTANGIPGPDPVSGPDPYRIQLYKDPDSGDS